MLINLFSGGRKHHVKSTLKFMRITQQQIYTVYMFVHFEDFFFSWNSRDINTHKTYNLTPDFKSKLFKCNNHILIKSSANKRSLNQLIGPAWNQTRFGRDELIIFCTQFLDTDLPFEWYLYFIYHVAKMLPQPIKLGLISETFYILEYLLKQLQTMF